VGNPSFSDSLSACHPRPKGSKWCLQKYESGLVQKIKVVPRENQNSHKEKEKRFFSSPKPAISDHA
jgi:hypothetical protein